MLKVRLQRVGRRNHAEFRVLVTESTRGPKSNNFIEVLGSYNPHSDQVNLDGDRIKYWIAQGAQVSDTVHNLLVSNKVIGGKKKNVLPRKSPPNPPVGEAGKAGGEVQEVKSEAPESHAASEEAPVEETAPANA